MLSMEKFNNEPKHNSQAKHERRRQSIEGMREEIKDEYHDQNNQ